MKDYYWKQFVKWSEKEGINLRNEKDYTLWKCWKAAINTAENNMEV